MGPQSTKFFQGVQISHFWLADGGCGFRNPPGHESIGRFSRGCGSRQNNRLYPGGRGVIGTNFFGGARKLDSGALKGGCGFRQ